MASAAFRYVIVGAGLAGASAVKGIRAWDHEPILLVGSDSHPPYHRPPLTKSLWFGRKTLDAIAVAPEEFWARNNVTLRTGTRIIGLDPRRQQIVDSRGQTFEYEKLLLATGGEPRRLDIPGGDLEDVYYYRTIDDYVRTRKRAVPGSSAVVIGGGFIGSEIAAALSINHVHVTMIFPGRSLVSRVLPEELGCTLVEHYAERGIRMMTGDVPVAIERQGARLLTRTRNGESVESDFVIVGIGITPSLALARAAGLSVGNGIIVDNCLQTSDPNVFAAGDNALFPSPFLDVQRRIEHWDNAQAQGQLAGANMAGPLERFDYMPYFFSDLFEFSYEGVGEVDTALDTWVDWKQEAKTGTIFYLRLGQVRGVLLCNSAEKLEAARELIKRSVPGDEEDLHWAL